MSELIIKNMPEKVHSKLKKQARKKGRTLQEHTLELIEDALTVEETMEFCTSIRARNKKPLTDKILKKAKTARRL